MHQAPVSKPRRRRRTYTAQFKTDLVAQCMDPAVSLAAVAIEHDLNPNVLRRWVIEHERLGLHDADAQPAGDRTKLAPAPANWLPFVPVQTVTTERLSTQPSQLEARIPLTLSGRGLTLIRAAGSGNCCRIAASLPDAGAHGRLNSDPPTGIAAVPTPEESHGIE